MPRINMTVSDDLVAALHAKHPRLQLATAARVELEEAMELWAAYLERRAEHERRGNIEQLAIQGHAHHGRGKA